MGPIDAVLGCDWLQSLAKISIDLNALSLEFCHKGRSVTLQGIVTRKLQVISARQLARELKKESAIYALNVSVHQEGGIPHVDNCEMQKLLLEFGDVFADMPLPPKRDVDHAIVLEHGSKPISKVPYRLSKVEREEVATQVQDLLEKNFIDHSTLPFASPVLLLHLQYSW